MLINRVYTVILLCYMAVRTVTSYCIQYVQQCTIVFFGSFRMRSEAYYTTVVKMDWLLQKLFELKQVTFSKSKYTVGNLSKYLDDVCSCLQFSAALCNDVTLELWFWLTLYASLLLVRRRSRERGEWYFIFLVSHTTAEYSILYYY